MKKFFIVTVTIILYTCSNIYGANSISTLQSSLKQITDNSSDSSTVSIIQKGNRFVISSKQVRKNTQFYIGSVTKQMTAYMLLTTLHKIYPNKSIEKLLNKKLNILFPKSPFLKSINRSWVKKITLLELLTHRSGLTDYLDSYGDGKSIPKTLNQPISAIQLLKSISFNPRKEYAYSNSNYLLLGKLIEEINHDHFNHIFNRMIKQPAKMNHSYAPISGNYFTLKKSKCCKNLAPNLDEKVFIDMSNALGAGNVISTRSDLVKWGKYLFKRSPKVIRKLMLKNYGTDPDGSIINLGLATDKTARLGELISHQGAIDSFNSFIGYAPESDMLIVILSNNNTDSDQLMIKLMSWMSTP